MKPVFLLFVSTFWTLTGAQYYYQGLMDYLDNRLLAIEDHMQLWHDQSRRYHTELLDFKKRTAEAMDGLRNDHGTILEDLTGAGVRVDRVEREMDFVETQTSPRACANKADKVVEQEAWGLQESRGEEEEEGGDWEELQSRVSDCVEIISGIRSVKILKRVGSPKGMWTRDPRSSKVYVFNGTSGDTIHQFDSVRDFSRSPDAIGSRQIRLPSDWTSPGSAVYNGYLYYVEQEEDMDVQVVKYDLMSGSVTDIAMFPVESQASVYSLNPEIVADLAADDEGLWLLYAMSDSEPNINLAKMDPTTLDIEQIWDTRCPRENAEAAFVVCGTVYVVYNTRLASRSRIQCLFDVNDMVVSEEAPLIYFPRRYGAHASLKYNPEEKQLYGWDDGYQIIYRLTMKRKLLV
ncbi:olfactomedin-like protein 3B isoform X1 [Notothenia coriiceps]|uniref:Olfactomedin-like protein 3B isoform X1 n=1 Tax=Notothenia coriiceps TaxID=8208 RepID=A0A6I9Q3I3_9TELE|nr:PREDICTED: olfactomedin-like protein 3B isoform X1 [Notothenia coriiceps]